ncbi:RusA family crossover junction endodeoxyribonuclease [Bradyrhizobium sp. AZCC 1693]
MWKDDKQVVRLNVTKRYANDEGVTVRVAV